MSEPYQRENLLDQRSSAATLGVEYAHVDRRERELLARHLRPRGGSVVSVGCGWRPGRHLFPAGAFAITAVDIDPNKVRVALDAGEADEGVVARAGALPFPLASFDVVLYRLVLHHIAYQGPLTPCFREAARLLAPGGALVAVEPNRWHPVGLGLMLANSLGLGVRVHGTPDDIPLSPRRLAREARDAGLEPEIFAVTFSWRRLAPPIQRMLWRLDGLSDRPGVRSCGHTLMLIAHKPREAGQPAEPET